MLWPAWLIQRAQCESPLSNTHLKIYMLTLDIKHKYRSFFYTFTLNRTVISLKWIKLLLLPCDNLWQLYLITLKFRAWGQSPFMRQLGDHCVIQSLKAPLIYNTLVKISKIIAYPSPTTTHLIACILFRSASSVLFTLKQTQRGRLRDAEEHATTGNCCTPPSPFFCCFFFFLTQPLSLHFCTHRLLPVLFFFSFKQQTLSWKDTNTNKTPIKKLMWRVLKSSLCCKREEAVKWLQRGRFCEQ